MISDAAWIAAESTLRMHFAARGTELFRVEPKRGTTLGAAFWVRYADGTAGLALVRGDEVLAQPSPASVDRLVVLDDLPHRTPISAEDFLYVLTVWNALPGDLGADPIRGHAIAMLNPRWQRRAGHIEFVLHAARKVNTGARPRPAMALRRAKGIVDAKGLHWQLEDIEVPLRP